MATYRIVANVNRRDENSSRAIPTFELNSEIQGIVSTSHAGNIARDIVDPWHEAYIVMTVWRKDDDVSETLRFLPTTD